MPILEDVFGTLNQGQVKMNSVKQNTRKTNQSKSNNTTPNKVVVAVDPRSPLLDPIQIGERDRSEATLLRDYVNCNDNVGMKLISSSFCGSTQAHCIRYQINGKIIIYLISYAEPVALITNNGEFRTVHNKWSTSTDKHIELFTYLATGKVYSAKSLRESYGTASFALPHHLKAVEFPRVTQGMLNTILKNNRKITGRELSVKSKSNNYALFDESTNLPSIIFKDLTLQEMVKLLIGNGLINYNQIIELNQPDKLQKFYRTKVN